MSRYGRRQIVMARVSHHNMPSAFDDVKAIGSLQTPKVVLSPAICVARLLRPGTVGMGVALAYLRTAAAFPALVARRRWGLICSTPRPHATSPSGRLSSVLKRPFDKVFA